MLQLGGFSGTSKANELAKRKYRVPLPKCQQLMGGNGVQEINMVKKEKEKHTMQQSSLFKVFAFDTLQHE
jgi:hypothetical protein